MHLRILSDIDSLQVLYPQKEESLSVSLLEEEEDKNENVMDLSAPLLLNDLVPLE